MENNEKNPSRDEMKAALMQGYGARFFEEDGLYMIEFPDFESFENNTAYADNFSAAREEAKSLLFILVESCAEMGLPFLVADPNGHPDATNYVRLEAKEVDAIFRASDLQKALAEGYYGQCWCPKAGEWHVNFVDFGIEGTGRTREKAMNNAKESLLDFLIDMYDEGREISDTKIPYKKGLRIIRFTPLEVAYVMHRIFGWK